MKVSFLLNSVSTYAVLNRSLVSALQCLSSSDVRASLLSAVPEIFEEADTFDVVEGNIYATRRCYVSDASNRLLLMGGLQTQAQALNLIDGWINPRSFIFPGTGISPGFGRAVNATINEAPEGWNDSSMRFFLVGHSYGGATLEALSAYWRTINRYSGWGWSYGAPRPGNDDCARWLRGGSFTRFYGEQDPVRFVPPRRDEAPLMNMLFPGAMSNLVDFQVHPVQGYCLQSSGSIIRAETWPIGTLIAEPAILSWMLGSSCFGAATHSLQWYADAFGRSDETRAPMGLRSSSLSSPETLYKRTAAGERVYLHEATNQARALGTQPQPIIVTPGDPLKYTARKRGKVWAVIHAEQVLAVGPGKRRAKIMARNANRQRTPPT